MSTKALTVVERARTAIGLPAEIEQQLTELAKKTTDLVVIVSPEDRAQVHGALMTIKNQRIAIEKAGEVARVDATKFAKAVIAEAGRLCAIIEPEEGRLFDLRQKWDDERENEKQAKIAAELKRVEDLQERVDELKGCQSLTSLSDPELLAEHLSDLEGIAVDDSFEEYRERADAAKAAGIARLQALHAAAVERVAEAERVKAERAELAKLRAEQQERERVAQEALKAEREEQARVAAVERARLDEEARVAKVARDVETARHNEQLRLQREEEAKQARERQAVVDAENTRIAEANRIEAERIAAERAEFDKAQAAERKAKAEEEAKRTEQARIAALVRPDDAEMIDVLAIHYNAPASRVIEWILSMRFDSEQLKKLAAA